MAAKIKALRKAITARMISNNTSSIPISRHQATTIKAATINHTHRRISTINSTSMAAMLLLQVRNTINIHPAHQAANTTSHLSITNKDHPNTHAPTEIHRQASTQANIPGVQQKPIVV